MGKCISCGECNKNYCYIILFNLLNHVILYTLVVFVLKINISNQIENKGIFIIPFLTYIGQSICYFPELFITKSLKNEKEKEKTKKKKTNTKNLYKKKSLVFELIFNDLSNRITSKDKIKIVNISLLLLIVDYLKQYISYRNKTIDGGSNFIEFLFLFIISKCLYDIKYYNHEYVSIFFLIILQVVKAIIKLLFIYKSYIDMIIDLTLEIFLGLCEAIVYSYFKYLMQIKFYSPYKTTYIFGFINGSITLILFIVFSFLPVGELGIVTYNEKKYFDNFFFIFDNFIFAIHYFRCE